MGLFRHLSPSPTPTSLPTPSITTASVAASDAQAPLSSAAVTLPQKPAALPAPDLQRTRDSLGSLTESSAPEIPTSDLRLGRELQRGGMGAVHTGSWFGTAVAVKVVLNRSRQEALLREAALLASLRHPCICQFFGISLVDGQLAVVMELLERSLHELIAYERRSTLLPVWLSLRVANENAQGIAYLHRNLMLHRDIKPSNVMLDQLQHAKVCDFGLSRPFTISKDDPGGKAFLELTSSKLNGSTSPVRWVESREESLRTQSCRGEMWRAGRRGRLSTSTACFALFAVRLCSLRCSTSLYRPLRPYISYICVWCRATCGLVGNFSGEEKRDHVRNFHGGQTKQYTTRGHSAMRSSSRTLTAPKLSRNLSSAVGGAGDATAGSAATAASAACEPSDDAERDGVVLSDGAAEGSCARYK